MKKEKKQEPKVEMTIYEQQNKSVERMIVEAIKSGVPVETMERILAMRKELNQEQAEQRFNEALATFQKSCPPILKKSPVKDKNGTVRYSYASLDFIIEKVKGLLAENGFSYSIRANNTDTHIEAVCKVIHKDGHYEESSFNVPIGSEAYMTDVQKYGARLTFAKRYAFCNAFGIMTTDRDTDAIEPEVSQNEIDKAKKLIDKCMDLKTLQKTWADFSKGLKANKEILIYVNNIKQNIENENSSNGATK